MFTSLKAMVSRVSESIFGKNKTQQNKKLSSTKESSDNDISIFGKVWKKFIEIIDEIL